MRLSKCKGLEQAFQQSAAALRLRCFLLFGPQRDKRGHAGERPVKPLREGVGHCRAAR